MNRIIRFFKSKGFAILLFHAGVLIFNWPLLSLPADSGGAGIFSYLVITWAVIVALLVLVGASLHLAQKTDKEG